jgi:hypothetical protein
LRIDPAQRGFGGSAARPARGGVALLCFALIVSALLAARDSGAAAPRESGRSVTPQCPSSALQSTAATDRSHFAPGQVVRMTFVVRNTSRRTCRIAVGQTSPSFNVTNAQGVEVWNNCYHVGQPGMCAQYLMLRTLRPGTAYVERQRWNQESGASGARAPAGPYELTVRYGGASLTRHVRFRLDAGGARVVSVTAANSGESFALRVGDQLVVQLTGPSLYTWTEPATSDATVLERTQGTSGATATGTFTAVAPGRARVTAAGNPACYPMCLQPSLMPSRLFEVTVTVTS